MFIPRSSALPWPHGRAEMSHAHSSEGCPRLTLRDQDPQKGANWHPARQVAQGGLQT